MTVIRTIVLDLDGPLLDGRQRHYYCYSQILKARGFEPVPLQLYWEKKRNRGNRRDILALSNAAGIYDEFLSAWISRIEDKDCLALDRLQNRVVEILVGWKYARIKLLLATMRNNTANLHWQLGQLGIAQLFDQIVVVGSSQSGANKSSEIEPFLENDNLDQVVWVGDTEMDIHAARELGVKICAVTCGLRTEEYLASLSPDMLEADLAAFAKHGIKSL
jgi:phosphoglycolate phosphatase-like HAD superfamily hydrolase